MKILFLSGWYPSRIHPQLGNFIEKHAEAVALQSEVVALYVCSDPDCVSKYEIIQNTVNNVFTVNVYYKKVSHRLPLLSQAQRAWRYMKAHFKGWRVLKKKVGKVDVVHLNILYPAGIFAFFLNRIYRYPLIITEHSTEYLPINTRPFTKSRIIANFYISRAARYITVVSKNLQNAMLSRGIQGRYKIVYNVVNTDLFVAGTSKGNRAKLKLIHISTLNDKHKNISGMLRTIAILASQRNDFECWFIGDGDTAPHIEYAKKLGIYNSIAFFDGTKTTAEVATIMKDADGFFMFSNYENLPCVIVEALACGLPVLSSDVGGISEHINASNGLLVKAGDEKALLNAFNNLIDNLKEKKYKPEDLRGYAVKHFSYKEVSKKFHEIYTAVLNHA